MDKPWNYGPTTFALPNATPVLVQLNVPHRGTLKSLRITSDDVTNTGTFQLYTSEAAATAAVAAATTIAATGIPVANYLLLSGSLTSGVFNNQALDIPYLNGDGSPTNAIQRLWLKLTSSKSGAANFYIDMRITTPGMI